VNDKVIIDGRETNQPTAAVAITDTGGIVYTLLHVRKNHAGTLGAAGSPFHTAAALIVIEGSGTYYIEASGAATGVDMTVPLVIVNNRLATVYLTSNENTGSWHCAFTEVILVAGTLTIGNNGSADVTTAVDALHIAPANNIASNVTVTIKKDCASYKGSPLKTSITIWNGALTTNSPVGVMTLYNGTVDYGTDLESSPETDMDIDELRQYGGTFNWYPDDAGSPYIGTINIHGGTFDASGTLNNDRAKVLGSTWLNVNFWPGATINIANGKGNITFNADATVKDFGATIIHDSGAQLALTYE
jgi:hypothetical protein